MSSFREANSFIDLASLTFSFPRVLYKRLYITISNIYNNIFCFIKRYKKENYTEQNTSSGTKKGFNIYNESNSFKDTLKRPDDYQQQIALNINRINNKDNQQIQENAQLNQTKEKATYLTDLLGSQRKKMKQTLRNHTNSLDACQSSFDAENHQQQLNNCIQINKTKDNQFSSLLNKFPRKLPIKNINQEKSSNFNKDQSPNFNKDQSEPFNVSGEVQVPRASILREYLNSQLNKMPSTQNDIKTRMNKQEISKRMQASSNMIRSITSMSDSFHNNSSMNNESNNNILYNQRCDSPSFRSQSELLFSNSLLNSISSEEFQTDNQFLQTQTCKTLPRKSLSLCKEDRLQEQKFYARELTRSLARAQTVKFNPHFHRKVQRQSISNKGNPIFNQEIEIYKNNITSNTYQPRNTTETQGIEILPSQSYYNFSKTACLPNLNLSNYQQNTIKPHYKETQKKYQQNLNFNFVSQNGCIKNRSQIDKSIDVQTWSDNQENDCDHKTLSKKIEEHNFKQIEFNDIKVQNPNNEIIDEATGSAEMSSKNSRCQSEYLLSIYDVKTKQGWANSKRNQKNNIINSLNQPTKCQEELDKERQRITSLSKQKVNLEKDKMNEKGSAVIVVVPNKIDIMKQVGIEFDQFKNIQENQQPLCETQLSCNTLKSQLLKEQQLREFQESYFDDLRREYFSNQYNQQLDQQKQQQDKGMYMPLASKQALKYFFNNNVNQYSNISRTQAEIQNTCRFNDRNIQSKWINTSITSNQMQDFCQQDILIGNERCQSSCGFSNNKVLSLKQHRMNTSSDDCNSQKVLDPVLSGSKVNEHFSLSWLENHNIKLDNSQETFNQRIPRIVQINSQQNTYSSERKQRFQQEFQHQKLHSFSASKVIKNLDRTSSSSKQPFPRDIFTPNVRAMKKKLKSQHL